MENFWQCTANGWRATALQFILGNNVAATNLWTLDVQRVVDAKPKTAGAIGSWSWRWSWQWSWRWSWRWSWQWRWAQDQLQPSSGIIFTVSAVTYLSPAVATG